MEYLLILVLFSLVISINNVIVLIDFMIIMLFTGYMCLLMNLFEIIMLMFIMLFSDFLTYLLMNGFMFMDLLLLINYIIILSINLYFYYFSWMYFNCIYSVLLEIGWSKFSNLLFDFNLLLLIMSLFFIISLSMKSISNHGMANRISSLNC